jgi:apolipoprotein D and lipocalin family protein
MVMARDITGERSSSFDRVPNTFLDAGQPHGGTPLKFRRLVIGTIACATLATATPTASAAPAATQLPVTTVPSVDLTRYAGKWLNLANIPSPFLQACARDIQAEYTALPDGLIKVVNSCVLFDGSAFALEGRARVVDATTNAKLQVTFVQQGGQFIFVPGGDYWVIGLSPQYKWAVVGDPDRSGGFVLSRTPTLRLNDLLGVLFSLLRSGYDPCLFQLTPTTGGLDSSQTVCEALGIKAT